MCEVMDIYQLKSKEWNCKILAITEVDI
jgi:hypothetical protein